MPTKQHRKIRIGVFGGYRGQTMVRVLAQHPDAELVAVCDRYRPALAACKQLVASVGVAKRVTLYADFDKFFHHDMDAVVLANYANEHAPFAIRLLESGRHVISEVLAVQTLDEAVRLAEAVERSKKVYAYAENYCYFRCTQEMKRLYRAGELGEFLHGEGEYVHDCESIWPQITYGQPGHWRNRMFASFYCTHSLGPLLTITGTRPVRVVGFETPNTGRSYGYQGGSSAMICCQMSNGATVKSLHATSLKREPSSIWYSVYGTKGMAESDRWGETINRVHLFRESDSGSVFDRSYTPRFPFESSLSRKIGGHGGSDFYTMHFFLEKILGRPAGAESIDVYTALDMTLPGLLAHRSILNGNIPQRVPDLRNKADRELCRGDRFCVDPAVAGDQVAPICSFPTKPIPPSVYRKVRRAYERARKSKA